MRKSGSIIKAKQQASRLMQASRLADAWDAFDQISRQAPGDCEVWLNLGAIAAMQGRLESAESALRRALTLNPDLPQANVNMARLLMMKGRIDDALPYLRSYAKLQPHDLDATFQLGYLLESRGDTRGAEELYRKGLVLAPANPLFLTALGRVLYAQGQLDEARQHCEEVLRQKPDSAIAWFVLGDVSREQRRFDEALHCYQKMVELAPQERENYLLSMALLCTAQAQFDAAQEFYHQLFVINPQSVSGHWNHSLLLLLLGHYAEGFAEYEWRWKTPVWTQQMWGRFQPPLWNGEPLSGKTILIYAEQGLGDAIQFGRYLLPLMQQAQRVIFHVPKELLSLFKAIPGLEVEVRDYDRAKQQRFDYHLPLMSLARIMGSTVDMIPAPRRYLAPSAERVAVWRERVGEAGFKVGLVWGGSLQNPANRIRSIPLLLCKPLAALAGVRLFSLQKDGDPEEQRLFVERYGMIDLGPELNDFEDTAAAIENLDLVITVDTAVAHMAGTLERPVWTLVYQPTEWRWLLGRDESPWYSTMRLFRQSLEEPCWPPVIERVAVALRECVAAQNRDE